jgi:hypothetical protein
MRAFALATLTVTGCAMLSAHAPDPDRHPWEVPSCNDGKRGVAGDAIGATVLGVLALAAAPDSGGAAVGLGLTGGAFAASAIAGNRSANRCRAAIEQYQAYMNRAAPRGRTAADAVADDDDGGDDRSRTAAARPPPSVAHAAPSATAPQPALAAPTAPATAPTAPATAPAPTAAAAAPTAPAIPPDHGSEPAPPGGADRADRPNPPPVATDPWSDFWKRVP